jgi:hypothetical protein
VGVDVINRTYIGFSPAAGSPRWIPCLSNFSSLVGMLPGKFRRPFRAISNNRLPAIEAG